MLGLLPSVVVVVAVCLFAPTCAVLLKEGEIGFSVSHLTPLLHRIEATDGRSALTAVVSRDQGLIACRVHDSMENVEKVLRYHNLTIQTIGLEEIQSTWSRCLMTDSPSSQSEARARTRRKRATPSDVIDYSGQPFPPDFSSGSPTGPGSSLAIVPGTKWCGKGNVAKTFDDLGE
ncbi:hypothetical protein BaRGS_00030522 [Batillaria attramentaria]|uniref:Phospholipase A2-like central domain-containing protein n=1 Tax=Batillaria attramentaria TaxID=370345 RepID=A0ABD0JT78_9CAEN